MSGPGRRRTSRTVLYGVLATLVVLLLARAVLLPSYSVPSASMEPTLRVGDRILVDRFVRGTAVHRGDVVVFDGRHAFLDESDGPPLESMVRTALSAVGVDTGTDYVKRVVGLPGDRVRCCDVTGHLVVDGVAVPEPYLAAGDAPSEMTFDVLVPAGSVWVMGDHRSVSTDSRGYLGRPGGGMVPLDDVVGQVVMRYWPPGRVGSLGGPGPLSTIPAQTPQPGAGS